MTTVAQNRWLELITVESAVEAVGYGDDISGGWRSCRTQECAVNADGGPDELQTIGDYASTYYGSDVISRPALSVGALIGMWYGPSLISDPFKIGSSAALLVPAGADKLILAFHDVSQWTDNYGYQSVIVSFDGIGPQTINVYAAQCIYFYFASERLLGPEPYYEDIDNGGKGGPHRPAEIDVPLGSPVVGIVASSPMKSVQSPINYPYLKLHRELFDPVVYPDIEAQEMLWQHGRNASEYHMFLLRNDTLNNVLPTYKCVLCNLTGQTIVAIKKTVRTPLIHIMNAINRGGILRQRL